MSGLSPVHDPAVWHDVECGSYEADLPLWRELAAAAGGPVLDIGAGTGRVALDLARHGHRVIALDRDPALLAVLEDRAAGLPVTAVEADMRAFDLGQRAALCLVPMQTLQLLADAHERAAFLACAARHLEPGAALAAALADPLEGLPEEVAETELPLPDMREIDGVVYTSQPTAVRPVPGGFVIERLRVRVDAEGGLTKSEDSIVLARLDARAVEAEGAAAGFAAAPRMAVPPTRDHVGSEVPTLTLSGG